MRSASRSRLTNPSWSRFSPRNTRDFGLTWSSRSANAPWSSSIGTARSFGRAHDWCFPAGPGRSSNPSGLPPDAGAVVTRRECCAKQSRSRAACSPMRGAFSSSPVRRISTGETSRQARRAQSRKAGRLPVRVPDRLASAGTGIPIGHRAPRYDCPLPLAVSRPGWPPVHAARSIACNQRPLRGARVWHRRNLLWASAWWPALRNRTRNVDG